MDSAASEALASLVAVCGLSCPCGILAPQPGIKPKFPALEDGFLTTGPPGKPQDFMAPHSSTLVWKIPWAAEPGGLQSMGS